MAISLIPVEKAQSSTGPLVIVSVLNSPIERTRAPHRHARGQLLGARRGLLTVEAADHHWVVPATHAVWIPPDCVHGLRSHGPFQGWSVYVSAPGCAELPGQPCIIATSGLLREAVNRAATWGEGPLDQRQERIAHLILDEVAALPAEPFGLPLPLDPRLRRIGQALADDLADNRSLAQWAQWAGLSSRTLARRFVDETGFSFSQWRQRIRLLRALELLAAEVPVTTIALELGYDNVSAFIAMFRRAFGVTPGRYFIAVS
ncbi:AraC family transcriptional regulator [Pseudomonas migulae]|uniref:AraC family transcriptional regulator n=1 Tax=Pseudomonas migulae TaxID=78543 RepID=UPI0020A0A269|nr:helix-turn-helix transcriptional regulator [Pseudomonas migulae]